MDKNINLPERRFYTLTDAADRLSCKYTDLIHFANIGAINLSAYVDNLDNEDNEIFLLSPSKINEEGLSSEVYHVHGLELTNEQPDEYGFYKYSFRALRGVFYISALNLLEMEFNEDISEVITMFIAPRPLWDDERPYIPNTMEQKIKVRRKNLCIHADDLYNFNKSPAGIPAGIMEHHLKSPTLTVHQFNMMYALLRIAGLSDVEIYNSSPNEINEKLSKTGAKLGVNVPSPDKNTWVKWRAKFK